MSLFGPSCKDLPEELKTLCKKKDILNPLKYIIITLYDYLTLPMYFWGGQSLGVGRPCTGGVSKYDNSDTPSKIKKKHTRRLEELKNSLKNKIIDFFNKRAGLDTEKIIENHVKNIIEAEEKTIKDLKETMYIIPSWCKSSAGHSKYKKEPKGLGTNYVEVWKFDKKEGIKKKFEWDVTWFKLVGKRQFIKEIFEDDGMPTTAKDIFKNIIDEKKDKVIPEIIRVTNDFIYDDYKLKYKEKKYHSDEVLIKWIKDQLDVYTPPEVVSRIMDGWYDIHVDQLAKEAEKNKKNNYSAQYNLKF